MSLLGSNLTDLSVQVPLFLVCIGGMILIIRRWRDHPRPSKYAFVGLSALLINPLITPVIYRSLFQLLFRMGWRPSLDFIMWSADFVQYTITAVGIVLLLIAVYTARLPHAARRAERVRDMDFPFDEPKRPLPRPAPVIDPDMKIRERKE